MPIYEFRCKKCGKEFEKILASTDISSVSCPDCNSPDITKVISSASVRVGSSPAGPAAIPSSQGCGGSGFS